MLLLTIIVLTIAGIIALLASSSSTLQRSGAGMIVAGTSLVVFSATLLMGIFGWNETADVYGVLKGGQIASLGTIILSIIGLLVCAGAMANPEKYRVGPGEFFAFVIFTVLGGVLIVSSMNLLTLFLGIELSSYSTYILVGYYRDDRHSTEASAKYFLLGALASALLLFGMSFVYAASSGVFQGQNIAGSLNYEQIGRNLSAVIAAGQALSPLIWPGLALILVGFGFKLALVPFHAWTPDAYQGAPSMVAALLSVGPKAASVIALATLLSTAFPTPELVRAWTTATIVLAAITMTVGNLQAMAQTNIKRLLGYSSVAQLGYVLIGVAVAGSAGTSALMFYVLGYVFTNIGAFTVISALSDAGVGHELSDYAGLVRRSPVAAVLLAGFFLSLAGVPLLAGFLGKLFVFKAAVDHGLVLLALIAVVNTVFAYYYYFRVIIQVFLAEPRETAPLTLNPTAVTALTIALVGVVVLGTLPSGVKGLTDSAAQTLPQIASR